MIVDDKPVNHLRGLQSWRTTTLASASPLHGLDRHVLGAVVLIRDITESRKIEEDLSRRVTRLIGLGVELEESTAR